jgi:hypothetical protein
MEQLRQRGVVRSSNNPAADYAEWLCARALRLTLNVGSTAGYDGVDPAGRRVEVKGRRMTPHNRSRQLSAIRGMEHRHFDALAGVLFNADFSVMRAALIPYERVKEHGTPDEHTNSWRFLLTDAVWTLPGVEDITAKLQEAEQS